MNNCAPEKGSYAYDLDLFEGNGITTVELKSPDGKARVLVVPEFQGRVMTSSSNGMEGFSFGWINHDYIESGERNQKFNPFGGEERLWLGPEGGPFSIFFEKGAAQDFGNWKVPAVIDSESFEIRNQSPGSVSFSKETKLQNAFGTEFKLRIEREVSLVEPQRLGEFLGVDIPAGLSMVAYGTHNTITNTGSSDWNRESGLLSIWLLGMFNSGPATTVFIPYRQDAEGVIVNDEYFGKVPFDRLVVDKGFIFFRADGKKRSKIGIPWNRAEKLAGSYDADRGILTLIWCSIPGREADYVNSNWGEQEDPWSGDVINSYNDGPTEEGTLLGPFYELESSSPALDLAAGGSVSHVQRTMHFMGEEADISELVKELFGLELPEIKKVFQ